jgi:hypothetical protein
VTSEQVSPMPVIPVMFLASTRMPWLRLCPAAAQLKQRDRQPAHPGRSEYAQVRQPAAGRRHRLLVRSCGRARRGRPLWVIDLQPVGDYLCQASFGPRRPLEVRDAGSGDSPTR